MLSDADLLAADAGLTCVMDASHLSAHVALHMHGTFASAGERYLQACVAAQRCTASLAQLHLRELSARPAAWKGCSTELLPCRAQLEMGPTLALVKNLQ